MSISSCKNMLLAQRWITTCLVRHLTTTSVLKGDYKNRRSGVPKITMKGNRPLTYEESQPPEKIGHTKSWNSWNSSSLHEEQRASLTSIEDNFIRSFMHGTFPPLLASHVIIKRRFNMINIAALILNRIPARKIYFLVGYSEEFLSCLLNCPVKLEVQIVNEKEDVEFRKI